MANNNLPGNDLAVGAVLLFVLSIVVLHTIMFFWSHIHFIDGQTYVLYERFWFSGWFKKTMAFPGFGRTFTIPLTSRIKVDPTGKLVQFSQKDIKETVQFTNIFTNNGAIVRFSFCIDYRISNIDAFIRSNELNTNYDHGIFISALQEKLKKEFQKQKLLDLKTERFQQWAEKAKNEFNFSKYGIVFNEITLKDADIKIPLASNPTCIKDIKKLLE
jgi:hypothetical protein